MRFKLAIAAASACLVTFPLAAQQPTASSARPSASDAGTSHRSAGHGSPSRGEPPVDSRRRLGDQRRSSGQLIHGEHAARSANSYPRSTTTPRTRETPPTRSAAWARTRSPSAPRTTASNRASAFTWIRFITAVRPRRRSTSPTSSAWKCCAARREPCSARTRPRVPFTSSAVSRRSSPRRTRKSLSASYDFIQAKGAVSGPLFGDVVAGRLSAQITQRDGVIHNVRTGEDLNELDNYALRGQLLFVPSENLKLRLIGDVSDLDSACCTQSFLRVGQSLRSAARQFPALAAGLGYEPASRDVYDRLSDIDADLLIDTQDGGVSLIADWGLGATTLTSVTAWRYWDWDVANDRDYTGIPIQMVQRIPSRQDQYSQELRLASNGDAATELRRRALLLQAGNLRHADQHLRAGSGVLAAQPGEFHSPDSAQPARRLRADRQLGLRDEELRRVRRGELRPHRAADRDTGPAVHRTRTRQGTYATQVFGGLDLTGARSDRRGRS